MHPQPGWAAVVADADVVIPAGAAADVAARVSDAADSLADDHRFSDASLLLTLRLAASKGAAHDRLAEVDAWHCARQSAAQADAARPASPPRSLAIAVLSFMLAVAGPIAAFPSLRTSADYFMDLEAGTVTSGVLATVAAIWFVVCEAARIPFAGTRARLYGPAVFVIFLGWLAFAIFTTLVRVNDEGAGYRAVPVGIALQLAAAALYATAFLLALRNRAEIRSAPAAAPVPRSASNEDDADRALRSRMDEALAGGAAEIDNAAAVEGVRKLFELDKLSAERARRALRSLVP